jgi:hypothetical protein
MLEEQGHPGDERRGKTQEVKGVEEVGRVDVVEEALYVKENSRGNEAEPYGRLGQMGKVGGAIHGRAVVTATKLQRAKKGDRVEVSHQMFGHNFLQELAAGLEESDGVVGLGFCVVRLVGFGNDDDSSVMLRVDPNGEASGKEGGEASRRGSKGPFKELVANAGGARCQGVGGRREGSGDFSEGDGEEGAGREGKRIGGEGRVDGGGVRGKELVVESGGHGGGVGGEAG